ncbi:ATP-binding protein [Saccharothrix variisporea]|uniref:Histidine kinase/DNA gyrase B/HSP90-like ATPase n=1 Tax=Saccharothrix variisporea TaxID=543527 RepID=A0A495XEX6_9PSEU|nr:ATP-binding protein [Saccharothrix variisporea]RKT71675.1 histidine kinase/DNA gyrase B/HSP90-like ATPase [Saccharothrix variisporea]
MTAVQVGSRERDFEIKVMGRTLEHLGVQMYKRRDAALAELVANAWDAGATKVEITLPEPGSYDPETSSIVVFDDGGGMDENGIEHDYLVIGRNRRAVGQEEPPGRRVMGRKGIGKLAAFGLARRMQVSTWRAGEAIEFELNAENLKTGAGRVADVPIKAVISPTDSAVLPPSGTRLTLGALKHKTPLDPKELRLNLARRFSRTVLGRMVVVVNGVPVAEPPIDLEHREPATDETTVVLSDGNEVKWWAGFSRTVLPAELQGLTILVRGKTAQVSPFFFGVEHTASGQHGTKYLTGVIEADYLDEGEDDTSDKISTDRQEIDWADDGTTPLRKWGEELVRRLLREHANQRGAAALREVRSDRSLVDRIEMLDPPSIGRVFGFVEKLGGANLPNDKIRTLAETVVQIYEYRHFHDYIEQLDEVAEDPELLVQTLDYMRGWKVVEGRAILEIVKGRIDILDKFHSMIVNDAPETAHAIGLDNMHDLVADYPWLINPEWHVLAEEKRITSQLREWGDRDIDPNDRRRYDFLALAGDGVLVVIEIKRSGHAVTLKDLQQIEGYVVALEEANPNVRGAFVTGDKYALTERTLKEWRSRESIELLVWREVYRRTRSFYEHYRAVLEGNVQDDSFGRKSREVARTRSVLGTGAFRGRDLRRQGLGPQDAEGARE